jgi:hypothetical protein
VENDKKKKNTTLKSKTRKQKMIAVAFGVAFSLLMLEVGLRIAGSVLLSSQFEANREGIDFDDPNQYRILCVGESTTAEWFAGGRKNSWPNQLEEMLNKSESGPRAYKVINMGISGTLTAFILARLEADLDAYRPHLVISMMGINDRATPMVYHEGMGTKIRMFFADLRIYKFFRILTVAVLERLGIVAVEKAKDVPISELGFIHDPERFEKIKTLLLQNNIAAVQDVLNEVHNRYPQKPRAVDGKYAELLLRELQKPQIIETPFYDEATRHFQKLIKRGDPNHHQLRYAYIGLSFVYHRTNDKQAYVDTVKDGIKYFSYGGDRHIALKRLARIQNQNKTPDPVIEQILQENGVTVKETSRYGHTKENYQLFNKKLKARGIPYVAVQYPTKPVRLLKYFLSGDDDPGIENNNGPYFGVDPGIKYETRFEDDPDIIFVSNEENFRKALEHNTYDELFLDQFGTTFGHTTHKGHHIIAKEVFKALIESDLLRR